MGKEETKLHQEMAGMKVVVHLSRLPEGFCA